MKLRKNMACVLLSSVLAIGLLAGCSTSQPGNQPLTSGETGTSAEDTAAAEGTAKGRYVETEVELPEEVKDLTLIGFTQGKDSRMELFAVDANEIEVTDYLHYSYDGSTWIKDPDWWGIRLWEQDLKITRVVYGADGLYYAGCRDEEYLFHLYRIAEDGTATEILPDVFKVIAGRSYGLSPDGFAVNSRGQILISSTQEAFLFEPDGTKLFTFPQDFTGSADNRTMVLTDEAYITTVNYELVCYSLTKGTIMESIPCEFLNDLLSDSLGRLFQGKGGGLYIASEAGLSHRNSNGTIWETLIEGSMTSLGMKSIYLYNFMEGEQNDYYGVFVGDMSRGIYLFHYTYDPDMAAVPPVILSVFALQDNSTIRQAASILQKKNPEIRVDFRVAMSDGDASMKNDIIRSLNTELLNGKGADVLILDGLPLDSYEKKGVLLDIRDVYAGINQTSPFLDMVTKDFVHEDGSVYYIPARFSFPILYGEDEAIEAFASLDTLRTYAGEKPLIQSVSYSRLLRIIANLQYSELFGNGVENLTQEMLIRYLETVKKLMDDIHGINERESEVYIYGSSYMPSSGIAIMEFDYDKGLSDCSIAELDSIYSAMVPWAILDKHPGKEFKTVHGTYFPSLLTGINQASVQKEAAVEFLEVLYSPEVQSIEFMDGFPVLREALDSWVNGGKEGLSSWMSHGDGYELGAEWPDQEKRRQTIRLVDTLSQMVRIDETVMEMITNGSKEYFEGNQTVEQAASAISQKIRLYLAE